MTGTSVRSSRNMSAIGFSTGWSGTRRTRRSLLTASVGLARVAHGPRTSGRETAAPQGTASDIGIASRHFGNASDPWRLEPDPRP